MDNTNLFNHSPKELVTDAFITWLFYYLDSDSLIQERTTFFNTLLLKEEDRDKNVHSIIVDKQPKGKSGRPDLVLTFNLNNKEKKILFENKTWTTTTESQLNGYRKDYRNIYRYIYLKLAYINAQEMSLCKANEYEVISSADLLISIDKLKSYHPFIEQYAEYLRNTFTNKINELKERILKKNDFKALKNAQGQQIFVSLLYEKLTKLGIENLNFKTGSSAGRPWTELDIFESSVAYTEEGENKNITETIFWRVDIRSHKYYVRLNQYTYNPPKAYLIIMKKKLSEMRSILNDMVVQYSQLNQGKLANRGKAEREIAIFFEDKNSILDLLQVLPLLSKKFIEEYKSINNYT